MAESPFKNKILHCIIHHDSLTNHSSYLQCYQWVKGTLFRREWRRISKGWWRNVTDSSLSNMRLLSTNPTRLLQPLPVSQQTWTTISMDFIEGLPKSQGYDVILVLVDCFTKFWYFVCLSHPYIASTMVELFKNHVFKCMNYLNL